jgi:predicted TIM-barrel fold metal-dependent hydrolase
MYDFHTHFITPEVIKWVKENKKMIRAKWEKRNSQSEFLIINDTWGFELKEEFINPNLYLNAQKQVGVHFSIVSPVPQLFLYNFPPEITADLARIYNYSLANWAKKHSSRLSALATIPLNHPEKAVEELAYAMNTGMVGAIIGPGVGEKLLSDPDFDPFWSEANKLNAIIFIHPLLNKEERIRKRKMPNLIGIPWETTISAVDLILSGHLDRYPNVKILLAHGGGFLPYQIGRLDKGYSMWKDVTSHLQSPPSTYLKRFWYDSVLWNDSSLAFLQGIAGENQIVPGSDFPFDLSTWPPKWQDDRGARTLLPMDTVVQNHE